MSHLIRMSAAFWLVAAAQLLAQAPTPEEIARSVEDVAAVLGMPPKKPVPSQVMSREEWRTWLDNELKRKVKPEEIRAQELALKMFGLVPRDFDLRKSTIDLYTEQAAAFYDSKTKKMTFVEGSLDQMVLLTLPHELAHAIADQHFNLEKFLDKDVKNDDAQVARLAVAEGQATWVMFELTLKKVGQSLLKDGDSATQFARAIGDTTTATSPVFQSAPLYIRRTLTFPYAEGFRFQQSVAQRLGKQAFTEVLRRPPLSTQHILHPEAYFANRIPTQPSLPSLRESKGFKRVIHGVLGELDAALLLEQYTSESVASKQAALWRGGAFAVLQHKKSTDAVLSWALEWESGDAARGFLDLYRQVLEGKLKDITWTQRSGDGLEGSSADGRFQVRLQGAQTVGLEERTRAGSLERPGL